MNLLNVFQMQTVSISFCYLDQAELPSASKIWRVNVGANVLKLKTSTAFFNSFHDPFIRGFGFGEDFEKLIKGLLAKKLLVTLLLFTERTKLCNTNRIAN